MRKPGKVRRNGVVISGYGIRRQASPVHAALAAGEPISRRQAIGCLAGIGSALLLGGCGASQGAVIVALFDASASTTRPEVRERYRQGFEKILKACRGGERMVGDTITGNSLASQALRLDVTFPAYDPWKDNPLTYRFRWKAALDAAHRVAGVLLAEQSSDRGTDLLNAFQMAEKVFAAEQNRGRRERILVVFSDLIQQSPDCDFASTQLSPAKIHHILAQEQDRGRLPRLDGVRVWAAGAAAGDGAELNEDQLYGIQAFWLAYFRACGADLPAAHYGTTLLDFHLSQSGGTQT